MKYLDLTLPTPEANLACDEALLDWSEEELGAAILRFWQPNDPFVVVGFSNRVEAEVNTAECRARRIPVLRRCSGGGTVLQGVGCLNYALVLRIEESGPTAGIGSTNRFVMAMHRDALRPLIHAPVEIAGHTDLTVDGRKFSGNAQRRRKHFLLFHGTILLNFDLRLIEELLRFPTKPPNYRRDRSHTEFLMNLGVRETAVKEALARTWGATERFKEIPWSKIENLVETKYSLERWNSKF